MFKAWLHCPCPSCCCWGATDQEIISCLPSSPLAAPCCLSWCPGWGPCAPLHSTDHIGLFLAVSAARAAVALMGPCELRPRAAWRLPEDLGKGPREGGERLTSAVFSADVTFMRNQGSIQEQTAEPEWQKAAVAQRKQVWPGSQRALLLPPARW